jgi:hypothetical protein
MIYKGVVFIMQAMNIDIPNKYKQIFRIARDARDEFNFERILSSICDEIQTPEQNGEAGVGQPSADESRVQPINYQKEIQNGLSDLKIFLMRYRATPIPGLLASELQPRANRIMNLTYYAQQLSYVNEGTYEDLAQYITDNQNLFTNIIALCLILNNNAQIPPQCRYMLPPEIYMNMLMEKVIPITDANIDFVLQQSPQHIAYLVTCASREMQERILVAVRRNEEIMRRLRALENHSLKRKRRGVNFFTFIYFTFLIATIATVGLGFRSGFFTLSARIFAVLNSTLTVLPFVIGRIRESMAEQDIYDYKSVIANYRPNELTVTLASNGTYNDVLPHIAQIKMGYRPPVPGTLKELNTMLVFVKPEDRISFMKSFLDAQSGGEAALQGDDVASDVGAGAGLLQRRQPSVEQLLCLTAQLSRAERATLTSHLQSRLQTQGANTAIVHQYLSAIRNSLFYRFVEKLKKNGKKIFSGIRIFLGLISVACSVLCLFVTFLPVLSNLSIIIAISNLIFSTSAVILAQVKDMWYRMDSSVFGQTGEQSNRTAESSVDDDGVYEGVVAEPGEGSLMPSVPGNVD